MSKTEALILLIASCGLFALFSYATFKFAVWVFKKLHE